MKALTSLCFLFCLSSCIMEPLHPLYSGSTDSCGFAVNQYTGEGLRWQKEEFPVLFSIHRSVPVPAEKNFVSAIDHWNMAWNEYLENKGVQPFDLFAINLSTLKDGDPKKDNQNILYFMGNNFSYYENAPGVQAVTAIYSTKVNIKDTDILVNDKGRHNYYYDESYNSEIHLAKNTEKNRRSLASSRAPSLWDQTLNRLKSFFNFFLKAFKKKKSFRGISVSRAKVPKDQVDFASLMIHELGHVPGMAHTDHPNSRRSEDHISVMEKKLSEGVSRRQIKEYDLESLFCAYYNY